MTPVEPAGNPAPNWPALAFCRFVLALIVVAVALLWRSSEIIHATATGPVRIMCAGDSITRGQVRQDKGDLTPVGYRRELARLVGPGFTFVGPFDDVGRHAGTNGIGVDGMLPKIGGWMETYRPDVVLLGVGTNCTNSDVLLSQSITELPRMLRAMKRVCPGAKILLTPIPPFHPDPTFFNGKRFEGFAHRRDIYNAALPEIAQKTGVELVHVADRLSVVDLSADGVHPSAAGYSKMAKLWANAITRP